MKASNATFPLRRLIFILILAIVVLLLLSALGLRAFNANKQRHPVTAAASITLKDGRRYDGSARRSGPLTCLLTNDGTLLLYCEEGSTSTYTALHGPDALTHNERIGIRHLIVGDGVSVIHEEGFSGFWFPNLTDVEVLSDLDEVGDRAFAGNPTLKKVSWSGSVTHMGDGVFEECWGLSEVTGFPDNDNGAQDVFRGCLYNDERYPSTGAENKPEERSEPSFKPKQNTSTSIEQKKASN